MMARRPDVHGHLYFRNFIFNSAVTYRLKLAYHDRGSMFHTGSLHSIISISSSHCGLIPFGHNEWIIANQDFNLLKLVFWGASPSLLKQLE